MSATLDQHIRMLQTLCNQGRYDTVLQQAPPLINQAPHDPRLLFLLGVALDGVGRREEARERLERAVKMAPAYLAAYHVLAHSFVRDGNLDAAHAVYDRALAASPSDDATIALKANLHVMATEIAAARGLLEERIRSRPVHPQIARAFGELAPRIDASEQAADIIAESLAEGGASPKLRSHCLYTQARLLDRLSRYDEAFDAAAEANGLRRGPYSADHHRLEVDRIIDAWSPERFAELPTGSIRNDRPVLVLGPPRSGTSLVEQILGRHAEVTPMGEWQRLHRLIIDGLGGGRPMSPARHPDVVTADALDRISRAYRAPAPSSESRFTDKHLGHLFNLGLVGLAMPDAKIVLCRRDIRDVCVSCYLQDLALPFACNLTDIASYAVDYRRLMDHWRRVIPNPVHEVRYERLVESPVNEINGLLEFLGLPPDDRCHAFHEGERVTVTMSNQQVQRPMYGSSVGRHRNYAKRLTQVVAFLADRGVSPE